MYTFITHTKIEYQSIQEYGYFPRYTIENSQYDKRPAVKLIHDSGGEETTTVGQ